MKIALLLIALASTAPATRPKEIPPGGFGSGGGEIKGDPATSTHPFVPADSIDIAEAKRRGITVEVVQLEHAQARIQELERELAKLKAPPTTKPSPAPVAKRAFAPTNTFTTRALGREALSKADPKVQSLWSLPNEIPDARKIDQHIADYLAAHPDVSDEMATAIYGATPKPGMTEEQILLFCTVEHTISETTTAKTVLASKLQRHTNESYTSFKLEIQKKDMVVQKVNF